MNFGKKLILTISELLIIVVIGITLFTYTKKQISPTVVYYYNREIYANSILKEKDISSKQIPKSAVDSTYVTKKEDIIGKVVKTDVYPNEIVHKDQLAKSDFKDPFKTMDLSEYRLFPIEVSYSQTLKGNLYRGTKVDLLYLGEGERKALLDNELDEDNEFYYTKTFLQDVLVYELTDETGEVVSNEDEPTVETTTEVTEKGAVTTTKTVTKTKGKNEEENEDKNEDEKEKSKKGTLWLALTLDQYEEAIAREHTGKVYLVNRFPESKTVNSKGFIINEYGPIPAGPGEAEMAH